MNQLLSLFLKSIIGVLFAVALLAQTLNAQQTPPAIEWQKSLGGDDWDVANSIAQTSDGGYIIAGVSFSIDGDVSDHYGGYDYWIVKLTSGGELAWQKALGGNGRDEAASIVQTSDGGYIVAGSSTSNNGDVIRNHGESDYWIVKLTSQGGIQWQKSLGGSDRDNANSIIQTSDGGYIVAGASSSTDGDVTRHSGLLKFYNYWIVKLTSTGAIEWQKALGGGEDDMATSIQQTSDGGYIVAGESRSADGDVSWNHGLDEIADYWIVKLTSLGVIEWEKSLGGTRRDVAYSIKQTSDGGYIVAGSSESKDGDVIGKHKESDAWVVKLTRLGVIEWLQSLGGANNDVATSVEQTRDGGYIVAGSSQSTDGDVIGDNGAAPFDAYWIVKLTSAGVIEWQKSLGGNHADNASSIKQTRDGGYIIAGSSRSTDGDVTGNHGGMDYWIVKLAPSNSTGVKSAEPPTPSPWAINANYPNPFSSTTTITFTVPERSFVRLSVDTEQGVEVARLIEEQLEAGEYRVPFSGDGLASGTYLYRLSSGSTSLVGKMTIVR